MTETGTTPERVSRHHGESSPSQVAEGWHVIGRLKGLARRAARHWPKRDEPTAALPQSHRGPLPSRADAAAKAAIRAGLLTSPIVNYVELKPGQVVVQSRRRFTVIGFLAMLVENVLVSIAVIIGAVPFFLVFLFPAVIAAIRRGADPRPEPASDYILVTEDKLIFYAASADEVRAVSRSSPAYECRWSEGWDSHLQVLLLVNVFFFILIFPVIILITYFRQWRQYGPYFVITDYSLGWRGETCRLCRFRGSKDWIAQQEIKGGGHLGRRELWRQARRLGPSSTETRGTTETIHGRAG